jgi:3-hydroxy-9,10-secoandrosta-1,3,5(10)-triene-9,17-dione monooxygenase reductase component
MPPFTAEIPGEKPRLATLAPEDKRSMREVLGHFATGVTVITAMDDDGPTGFACQSFHALSLEPALICFCVGRGSSTWPRINRAGRFTVNVLERSQEQLCQTFAVSGGDKFAGVDWSPSPLGSPVLDGAMAWVDCTIAAVHDGGDHHIVIGRVRDLVAHGGDPLLFFRGQYRQLL